MGGCCVSSPVYAVVAAEEASIIEVDPDEDWMYGEIKLNQHIPALWIAYDKDNDGWLNVDELKGFLAEYIEIMTKQTPLLWSKTLFVRVDTMRTYPRCPLFRQIQLFVHVESEIGSPASV